MYAKQWCCGTIEVKDCLQVLLLAARNGTARHGTARHGTAQDSTAKHSVAQHNIAQHGAAQHGAAQHGTAENFSFCMWAKHMNGTNLGHMLGQLCRNSYNET